MKGLAFTVLTTSLMLSGCASGRLAQREDFSAADRSVVVVYSTDSPEKAIDVVSNVSLEEVGGDLLDQMTFGYEWSHAELTIAATHPDGHSDLCHVTLRLSRSAENDTSDLVGGPGAELWSLDIPRGEMTAILKRLEENGCFEDQTRPSGGVELTISQEGRQIQKQWSTEPVIEALMSRTWRTGQLEGLAR